MQQGGEAEQLVTRSAGQEAILEAAVQLFSERGYDGVSMRSVAEAAGVSKANIYHHFASKEALYLAILRTGARRLSDLVEGLAASKGPFDQRLSEFAAAHLRHLLDNASNSRLMLREAFSGDDERRRLLADQVIGNTFERVIAIFREGQEAGVLRPELDPALCAALLMGADVFFFQAQGMLRHFPEAAFAGNTTRFSEGMMEILLHGMLSDGGAGERER
jgi:TetR/AcrR family transcriptional regulator